MLESKQVYKRILSPLQWDLFGYTGDQERFRMSEVFLWHHKQSKNLFGFREKKKTSGEGELSLNKTGFFKTKMGGIYIWDSLKVRNRPEEASF